jgi:hypothetical protein
MLSCLQLTFSKHSSKIRSGELGNFMCMYHRRSFHRRFEVSHGGCYHLNIVHSYCHTIWESLCVADDCGSSEGGSKKWNLSLCRSFFKFKSFFTVVHNNFAFPNVRNCYLLFSRRFRLFFSVTTYYLVRKVFSYTHGYDCA